jgi:predicted HicB family RNase H-like nuclease
MMKKTDLALGLVPFAVKLNGDLVARLQALAKERGVEMNQLVAEVLEKGLAD